MPIDWLTTLKDFVREHPIPVLKFTNDSWEDLNNSENGLSEFTLAKGYSLVNSIKVPSACLILSPPDYGEKTYFGLLTSRNKITTLESRIKLKRVRLIKPGSVSGLHNVLTDHSFSNEFKKRLSDDSSVIILSPFLSVYLMEQLASIDINQLILKTVADVILRPKRFNSKLGLQDDALRTVMSISGMEYNGKLEFLSIEPEKETALPYIIPVIEDSVIEHDARYIINKNDKYKLISSDVTGRAVFQSGTQKLEIYTANRKPLEKVFGVDLIYLNLQKQNIVMLQYKMLEPLKDRWGKVEDWIYRPDEQLAKEVRRMKVFSDYEISKPEEYRLNPDVFYLKFVKRNALIRDGGIIIPLNHYEFLVKEPELQGKKEALKISYQGLNGRYIRYSSFINLVSSGYIGAHSNKTKDFKKVVDFVLARGNSAVAAIQSSLGSDTTEL